jgi:chromosomal replication initiator protein
MTGSIWDQVLARIETKVNQHIYSTWFKPTSFVADDGAQIRVRVPNALFSNWLNKHYSVVLGEALAEVNRQGCLVSFVTTDEAVTATAPAESVSTVAASGAFATETAETDDLAAGSPGTLAPRYSFDAFIVGPSNQFAHAACRAVAEAPSRSYNPLFIYGGVGLGKTHLMHAIGHYVLTHLTSRS